MSSNAQLFERACRSIPGGVNSPVRAFRSVGGTPRFIKRAQGPYVWDAEDKQYIDYVGSWGPAILGHSHPEVVRAVQEAAVHGLSFGAPTEAEIELAETLIARLPSLEQVRLVSSGTEATMTAIRLARGATGRAKIVKFEGCYHGHSDSLLVKAGSGLLTFGNPSSAGVPPEFVAHTLTLEYNNLDAVREAFAQHGADIACVIVEPVAGNMNLIKPAAGFLEGLREVCTAHGALLIFDEVMTGFRVGPQGVQGLTGVKPDLTTLAKVIGGGMPVGAFGGSADIMKHIAPLGGVYQAGTLSGNPVAVAAGLATLRLIAAPGFYESCRPRPPSWPRACRSAPAPPAWPSRPTRWAACSASTSANASPRPSPRSRPATPRGSTVSFTPCWTTACISRRPRSKPASSRPRTTTPSSHPRWTSPKRSSRRCERSGGRAPPALQSIPARRAARRTAARLTAPCSAGTAPSPLSHTAAFRHTAARRRTC